MTDEEPPDTEPVEHGPDARRRRRRRAVRPGTSPAADDARDLMEPSEGDATESPHDRWLREQRPPHWE